MAYKSYDVPVFPKDVLELTPYESSLVLSKLCPKSHSWDTTQPMDMNQSGSVWASWLTGCLSDRDTGQVCPQTAFGAGRPRSESPWIDLPTYTTESLSKKLHVNGADPRQVMMALYDSDDLKNEQTRVRATSNRTQMYMLW
jgi:hypothetical protein